MRQGYKAQFLSMDALCDLHGDCVLPKVMSSFGL